MDMLMLKINFNFYNENTNIVKELHEIYRKHGMKFPKVDCEEDENISYEEACKVNQFCYDNNVNFEEWVHYRMSWNCDWVSFIDTTPSIDIIPYNENEYYHKHKAEYVMFPEDEIYEYELNEIFKLMKDLYELDYVTALELQKEYC